MSRHRRVTFRCIVDDLLQDWEIPADQAQVVALRATVNRVIAGTAKDSAVPSLLRGIPRLNKLRHPLIESFDVQFAGKDDASASRESISAVSDRAWWKQKSSRWRGAATIVLPEVVGLETAWLGAAGYRRAGSSEDFYEWFASECGDGSDKFLPQAEDRELERIDVKIAMLDSWKAQLHLSSLVLLANAIDTGSASPVTVLRPEKELDDLLDMSISLERISEGEEEIIEVIVEVRPRRYEYANLNDIAARGIMAAIEPDSLAWTVAPLGQLAMSYRVLATHDMLARATEARSSGLISEGEVPGAVRLGTIAHYALRTGLTEATIEGEAVHAICGHWFVPRHDHAQLQVCVTCADARDRLPE